MKPQPKADRPWVTALVIVHNERRHIDECLRSLKTQTYHPLEIIVVDDGSTDGTATSAKSVEGVQVLSLPHGGKAKAIAAGAAAARGEVLLFLDGDMVFSAPYVERLVEPILKGVALGTAHDRERVANAHNPWAACWQTLAGLPPEERLRLSADQRKGGSTVYRAVLRKSFLEAGGFDDVGYVDDQTLAPKLGRNALWVEAEAQHYNLESLNEVWALGRWTGKSLLHQFGPRALARFSFPVSFVRALALGVRHRRAALVPYVLVRDLGIFTSLLRGGLGIDHHTGK